MRLLANENISRSVIRGLRGAGHLPASSGVILLRITPQGRERDSRRILGILLGRDDWTGAFWVVTDRRIRKRPLPKPAP